MTNIERLRGLNEDKLSEFLIELCSSAFQGTYSEEEYTEGKEYIKQWLLKEC